MESYSLLLPYYISFKGDLLKKSILMTLVVAGFVTNAHADKFPTENEAGFENINKRQEYEYYGYEDEVIWHEFGRPYWRKKIIKKAAIAPKKPVVEQKVVEKRAATIENLGSNYDAKRKSLTLDVKFELNKARINESFTSAIDALGMALKNDKELKLEIQGHTDTTGDQAFNEMLSSKRAAAVKTYLMDKYGVASARLTSKGYGPAKPIASNETRDGREQNRRVDIKVINVLDK